MGAILLLLVVVACVYAILNPAEALDVLRALRSVTRQNPEGMLFLIAVVVLVSAVLWLACRLLFPRRMVTYSPGSVMTAAAMRTDHEAGPGLERIARHEAAHTLAAYFLGATHLTADVYRVGERGGQATYRNRGGATVWDEAYDALVIGFAGQAVDHQAGQFDATSLADMAAQQRRMMVILSAGKRPLRHHGPLTVEALIESARAAAEQLLVEHPAELERIAAALVEKREIDDVEIRELVTNSEPAIAA
jgi:hypothetical protein